MFTWIKSVYAAGQRLAAALNALAETAEVINSQARTASGLDALPQSIDGAAGPAALPAPTTEPASDEAAGARRKKSA